MKGDDRKKLVCLRADYEVGVVCMGEGIGRRESGGGEQCHPMGVGLLPTTPARTS